MLCDSLVELRLKCSSGSLLSETRVVFNITFLPWDMIFFVTFPISYDGAVGHRREMARHVYVPKSWGCIPCIYCLSHRLQNMEKKVRHYCWFYSCQQPTKEMRHHAGKKWASNRQKAQRHLFRKPHKEIYSLPCNNVPFSCGGLYIGQTGRCVMQMLMENKNSFTAGSRPNLYFFPHCQAWKCAP